MKLIHIACAHIGILHLFLGSGLSIHIDAQAQWPEERQQVPDDKPVVPTTPSPYNMARVRTQKHRPETPTTTPAATAAQPTGRS